RGNRLRRGPEPDVPEARGSAGADGGDPDVPPGGHARGVPFTARGREGPSLSLRAYTGAARSARSERDPTARLSRTHRSSDNARRDPGGTGGAMRDRPRQILGRRAVF